jgi:hypothetical protein
MIQMLVRCILCGAEILLNEDSAETRKAGTDPHQQMRDHIDRNHSFADIGRHQLETAWLVDMLFFRCPSDPERWKAAIDRLLMHHLEKDR